jgi:hypothetical protein
MVDHSLSHDCYSLLRSIELLAFDFIFAPYLIGQIPGSPASAFLDSCIYPRYNLSIGGRADFEKAAQYIKFLEDLVALCAADLLRPELRLPDIPRRTS